MRKESQRMRRTTSVVALLAATSLALAACGGSGGSTDDDGDTGTPPPTSAGYDRSAANSTGTPVKGGVLNVLGVGDVDFLDPNITYYSVGYEVARLMSRQLYSFPAVTG